MKILYIGRLFSGLETSLLSREWRPTGAPTIFKIIEALDKSHHEVRFILTCKDGASAWLETTHKTVSVTGLNTPIQVLSGVLFSPHFLGRLRQPLRELCHLWEAWKEVQRFAPDIIYLGHADIWSGGFLARLTRFPVVFRMMGVYPAMRNALVGNRLSDVVLRWCYRAPFAAAICTQDGSGIEKWLDTALSPNIPTVRWVNGVDVPPLPEDECTLIQDLPRDRTIVLFIGHLDSLKGCDVFVDAVLDAIAERPNQIQALIIGTGNRLEALTEKIKRAGQEQSVTIINRLPHAQISEAHRSADIYVSLNRLGNLSNANLEAMKQGQCVVLPNAQPALGIDTVTEGFIPEKAALRIRDADDKEGLVEAILTLHDSPALRQSHANLMLVAGQKFIPGWEERIEKELRLLEHLATGQAVSTFCQDRKD